MPRRWGCGACRRGVEDAAPYRCITRRRSVCRAEAHMGASLQGITGGCSESGGVEPRPYAHHGGFASGGQGRPPLRITEGAMKGYYGCPCCGAQNFCAALRRPLKILTAATRSSRFIRHRRRSIRSPHQRARWFAMTWFLAWGCGVVGRLFS